MTLGPCILLLLATLTASAEPASPPTGPASAADSTVVFEMPTFVTSAPRIERKAGETPNVVHKLDADDLRNRMMVRTVPEALKELPGVMVQKTAQGQGSPFIRGFTGFRTLFLIDGIRLNNSVFREGPNQYWATVDAMGLASLEVMRGPSAVLSGSEAVGGTVRATTKSWDPEGIHRPIRGDLFYRFSSAENAQMIRGEASGAMTSDLGYYLGLSLKDFGDLRAGPEVGAQAHTGYEEWSVDGKLVYRLAEGSSVTLAHQNLAQDDVWRTHRTLFGESWRGTTVGNEQRRSLDQKRHLTYAQLRARKPLPFARSLIASASYQVQKEERLRIRSDDRSDRQGFDVGTIGAWVEMESRWLDSDWIYGIDYYRDDVDSYAEKFAADGTSSGPEIQGPVGDDAIYDLLGLYVRNNLALSPRFDLFTGLRFTYAAADARRVENPVIGEPMRVQESWNKLIASGRVAYYLQERDLAADHAPPTSSIFFGIGQGFRAPNLSDLTRFDSARSNEIENSCPRPRPRGLPDPGPGDLPDRSRRIGAGRLFLHRYQRDDRPGAHRPR